MLQAPLECIQCLFAVLCSADKHWWYGPFPSSNICFAQIKYGHIQLHFATHTLRHDFPYDIITRNLFLFTSGKEQVYSSAASATN